MFKLLLDMYQYATGVTTLALIKRCGLNISGIPLITERSRKELVTRGLSRRPFRSRDTPRDRATRGSVESHGNVRSIRQINYLFIRRCAALNAGGTRARARIVRSIIARFMPGRWVSASSRHFRNVVTQQKTLAHTPSFYWPAITRLTAPVVNLSRSFASRSRYLANIAAVRA
jgi:hypothetical protein